VEIFWRAGPNRRKIFFGGRNVPDDFPDRIRKSRRKPAYGLQRQQLRTYKTQMLLTLCSSRSC
jgi:hypothetical protein